jgi:hypothetical protein
MARGRSQWRRGRLKMEPRGVCVKKWSQNRITLYRNRIRICIKVISRIRIRIKVISRDPDPHQSEKRDLGPHQHSADPVHWVK